MKEEYHKTTSRRVKWIPFLFQQLEMQTSMRILSQRNRTHQTTTRFIYSWQIFLHFKTSFSSDWCISPLFCYKYFIRCYGMCKNSHSYTTKYKNGKIKYWKGKILKQYHKSTSIIFPTNWLHIMPFLKKDYIVRQWVGWIECNRKIGGSLRLRLNASIEVWLRWPVSSMVINKKQGCQIFLVTACYVPEEESHPTRINLPHPRISASHFLLHSSTCSWKLHQYYQIGHDRQFKR